MTTGALTPRSITQVVVLVNGPKTLLSPAVNVVVNVNEFAPEVASAWLSAYWLGRTLEPSP